MKCYDKMVEAGLMSRKEQKELEDVLSKDYHLVKRFYEFLQECNNFENQAESVVGDVDTLFIWQIATNLGVDDAAMEYIKEQIKFMEEHDYS